MREKKRLVGLSVLGWSEVIFGILLSLSSIILSILDFTKGAFGGFVCILGVIIAIVTLAISLSGVLILRLNSSGRIITLVISYFFLINSLVAGSIMFLLSRPEKKTYVFITLFYIPIIILCLGAIYYLTRPKVKEQFR